MSEGQVGTVQEHHTEGPQQPRGLQILLAVRGEAQASQQLQDVQLEENVRAGEKLLQLTQLLCRLHCLKKNISSSCSLSHIKANLEMVLADLGNLH